MERQDRYDEEIEDIEDVEDVEVVEASEEQETDSSQAEAEASDESNPENEPVDSEEARKEAHRQRVSRFAARFAALVAKGEQVMAALDAKADAADEAFNKKAAEADEKIDEFAAVLQDCMEKTAEQLAEDLEVIAKSVDGGSGEDESATGDAETDEPVSCDPSVPYQPQFTPGAQVLRERMRVGSASDLLLTDPEFVERFANFAFDDVPSDVDLSDRTRFMCWLATLLGCQGIDEFRALLPAALNVGVEPEAVKEIVYQATAYLGIGRVYPFLKATNEALTAAGVQLPLKPQATTAPTEESRYAGGEDAQVACFGEQMHGYKDRGAADYPHIAQWLVKNCFGDWYTRGGLTIAEREMCTFCYLAAQGGCEPQLRSHVAANVHCGNDRAFLIKVVSNNVPFIGYPRTLNAMAVMEEVTGSKE